MISHIWSIICQGISIDNETNSISIFNVLEQITLLEPQQFNIGDVIPLQFQIISDWTRNDSNIPAIGKTRIQVFSPTSEGKPSMVEMDIDLSKHLFFRSRILIQGLKWRGFGKYTFIIELLDQDQPDWQKVSEIPFWIGEPQKPPEPQTLN